MTRFWPAMLPLALLVACGDDDADPSDAGSETDTAADTSTSEDAGPDCDPGEIPGARGELEGVLDAMKNRLVVFGGNVVAPEMCVPAYEYTTETWAFDLGCQTWSRLDVDGPPQRGRQAVALDTNRNRLLSFGGRDTASGGGYQNFNDVWAFDLATDTWSEVTTTGDAPSPRHNATAVYDSNGDRLIVFGGNPSEDGLVTEGTQDTFALDLESGAWTEIGTADPRPRTRYYHAAVEMDGKLYVFGGNQDFFTALNDTWELDLATDTWRMVSGGGPDAPTTRFGATLFADSAGGRILMVSGHDSTAIGNVNDIWALDVATSTWTQLFVGDTINNPIMTACDPPADFANMELSAPERRHGNARAQSATLGYVIFGKTDCGNVNDVWSIDLANPSWTLVGASSTSGEACERSGNTMCTRLCF